MAWPLIYSQGIQAVLCQKWNTSYSSGTLPSVLKWISRMGCEDLQQGFHKLTGGTISDQISRFFLQYRFTPHSTSSLSPAELHIVRQLTTWLDLLKPNLELKVNRKHWKQKLHHDKHCRERKFTLGGRVFVTNHNKGNKWLSGQITRKTGGVSFEFELDDGRMFRCHQCKSIWEIVTSAKNGQKPHPQPQWMTTGFLLHQVSVFRKKSFRLSWPMQLHHLKEIEMQHRKSHHIVTRPELGDLQNDFEELILWLKEEGNVILCYELLIVCMTFHDVVWYIRFSSCLVC